MTAAGIAVRLGSVLAVVSLAALCGCATVPRTSQPAERPGRETGVASYYAKGLDGRRTANGERYDSHALTAAHRTLPFGSRVRVTNLDNGRSVVVRINDRGPHVESRVIDLSYAAARELQFIEHGTAHVTLEVLGHH